MLGHAPTPQMKLCNRLEAPWFANENRDKYPWWIMCDQLAVAVALDPSIVTEVKRKQVSERASRNFYLKCYLC